MDEGAQEAQLAKMKAIAAEKKQKRDSKLLADEDDDESKQD